MTRFVPHRHLWSPDSLSSAELHTLLDTAAALKRTTHVDQGWGPLRGRHVALLCSGIDDATIAFRRAVHELGGTVAVLDANDWQPSPDNRVSDAARVLGRLYDAIDCCGLPPRVVEQIEAHSGVPVFNGVSRPEHPLRKFIVDASERALLARSPADHHRCELQALIVCGIQ